MSAITTVHFTEWYDDDDPPPPRDVTKCCRVCGVTEEDVRSREFVVSPQGVAHFAAETGDTECGHDATRELWWWPL